MSLTQALIARRLDVQPSDLVAAMRNHDAHAAHLRSPWEMANGDTPHRRHMRALLDGAGLANAHAKLAFLKNDGKLRYMLCEPVPGADQSARYVTVKDLELSAESDRPVYRRVDLDTVARCTVEYGAR